MGEESADEERAGEEPADGKPADQPSSDAPAGPPVRIRPASAADRPRLAAIQSSALSDPWPELLDAAIDGPPTCLVAEPAGEVAAESTLEPVGYALALRSDERAYLAELAVAPDHRRLGIGRALLGAVREHLAADGVETLRLTVRADDADARAFYDAMDAERVDRDPGHYDDGTDGLVLVLSCAAGDGEESTS